MSVTIASLAQRPDLEPLVQDDALSSAWPRFMVEDPLANLIYASGRLDRFHDYVLVAFDPDRPGLVLGRGVSVPFCLGPDFERPHLPAGGWDTVVRWADQDHFLGKDPNVVSALEIVVRPDHRGRGLSSRFVEAMRANTARLGFEALYAPVRPNQKHLVPHAAMSDYVARTREDGLPADAWLRVHVRAGGHIVGIAPCSMTIAGTRSDWRSWTGLPFEQTGDVVVPGALAPVHVSVEQDYAVYVEPNVWVHHRLSSASQAFRPPPNSS